MTIKIFGDIGWDVSSRYINYQIAQSDGDILIEIDSPGGYISDAITMFNAIKNYDKGQVVCRVVGEACSAASYLMFAGDKLEIARNAVIMIHNPLGGIWGDYKTISTYASYLEKLAKMFCSEYSKYTSYSEEEMAKIMDEETYFIGTEELSRLGQVIEFDKAQPDFDREILMTKAKENMSRLKAKMTKKECEEDLDAITKMMSNKSLMSSYQQQSSSKVIINNESEVKMNRTEFEKQYPDVYQEVLKSGKKLGIDEERSRVNAHITMMDLAPTVAVDAIKNGEGFTNEIQAKYMRAGLSSKMIAEKEAVNPAKINPDEVENSQANGGKSIEEMRKDAEIQEQKDVRTALANMGKVLPECK